MCFYFVERIKKRGKEEDDGRAVQERDRKRVIDENTKNETD